MDNRFIDTTEWIPIHTLSGFECCIEYYINRKGQVKSTKGKVERLLKPQVQNSGYPFVKLQQLIGRKGEKSVCIHKLVAFAFLPPPSTPYGRGKGKTVINHIDHDKTNCCVENLEWSTYSDNNRVSRPRKFSDSHIEAAKERQRISKRDYMRRQREKLKAVKIEESDN